MSASSTDPVVADAVAEALAAVRLARDGLVEQGTSLRSAVKTDREATLDPAALDATERAITMGIAVLSTTRADAAAALEASVAGATPRSAPALARDLLLIVDALTEAIDHALTSTDTSARPDTDTHVLGGTDIAGT